MNKQSNELKQIVEAAILVADDPISINRIISMFPDGTAPERKDILQALDELSVDCENRGVEIKKVGSGYRFQSKERYAEFLRKLYEMKPPRYSRAVMETLSIIAYRQPVTRGDIEDVRGVSVSTEIMRTLLNRQWVREVGYKDVPGRPALFATTKEFLAYFNLKSIRDMPVLQQKRELEEIAKDNQITLPLEQPDSDPGAVEEGVTQPVQDVDDVTVSNESGAAVALNDAGQAAVDGKDGSESDSADESQEEPDESPRLEKASA